MIVEIVLIQKYALFIGPSVYSISTVLLTLLLASGIGSRLSPNISAKVVFSAILLWLLADILIFDRVIYALGHLSLVPRMSITALLLFPLGLFMGMPFPKAALRVGELVDWGFTVNGAASVLGSTAVMLVAFSWGFHACLLIAALLYVGAGLMYRSVRYW